jgi:hypothetical protein
MYLRKIFSPTRFRNGLRGKAGSTLIWALIIVVIITLVLAAGFAIVQRQQNSAVSQHIENQAYYSAMSVTQAIMTWLHGTGSVETIIEGEEDDPLQTTVKTPQQILLEYISNPDINAPGIDIPIQLDMIPGPGVTGSADLDRALRDVQVYASWDWISEADKTQVITFTVVSNYLSDTATVSAKISKSVDESGDWHDTGLVIEKIAAPPAPWRADGQYLYPRNPDKDPTNPEDDNKPDYITNTSDPRVINWNSTVVPEFPGISTSPEGYSKITSSKSLVTSNANTIIIGPPGDTGTPQVVASMGANVTLQTVIVKKGGVLNIGGNNFRCDELIIEDGGRVTITANSSALVGPKNAGAVFNEKYVDPPDTGPIVYILPGGLLSIAGDFGNTTFSAIIYAYAAPVPGVTAIDFGSGKLSLVRNIILQPSSSETTPPSYYVDVGTLNGVTSFAVGDYRVHIPIGYKGLNTSDQAFAPEASGGLIDGVISRSCNHLQGPTLRSKIQGTRTEYEYEVDPFCPHFLAPNEPRWKEVSTVWTVDGYYEKGWSR